MLLPNLILCENFRASRENDLPFPKTPACPLGQHLARRRDLYQTQFSFPVNTTTLHLRVVVRGGKRVEGGTTAPVRILKECRYSDTGLFCLLNDLLISGSLKSMTLQMLDYTHLCLIQLLLS